MAYDSASLDAPFAALAAFDWGQDAAPLEAIDDAVNATHGDANGRSDLEKRLVKILEAGPKRAAKEYACRKLSMIGTATAVPALATLLYDAESSHMARFALERIAAPEATAALRTALGMLAGGPRVGIMDSLAARGDEESLATIAGLLAADELTAVAAAKALGAFRSPAAADALAAAAPAAVGQVAAAIADARFECAEELLRQNKRTEAAAIYAAIAAATAGKPESRLIELAATRGLVACADALAAT
ncbi:hypothetical protein EBR04_02950 [bacterium]|nr:hypothetical protein [bacterium]